MNKSIIAAFWAVTLLAFGAAIALLFTYTPIEATMGRIQRIFYVHLPTAICTFVACLVNFIACIAYLSSRKDRWDDLADASARVGVMLCSIVLLTGMIWGKAAWGQWWTWSPRLTFSLVLWFLYVVYLMVRAAIESGQRRAVIGAVYGIIAFLDVPLVYLSVRLMPDIHPTSIELAPGMKVTLGVWFIPLTLLTVGLISLKYASNERKRTARIETEIEATSPTGFSFGNR